MVVHHVIGHERYTQLFEAAVVVVERLPEAIDDVFGEFEALHDLPPRAIAAPEVDRVAVLTEAGEDIGDVGAKAHVPRNQRVINIEENVHQAIPVRSQCLRSYLRRFLRAACYDVAHG